ncbi:unnamed protein product [Brassica oleracea]
MVNPEHEDGIGLQICVDNSCNRGSSSTLRRQRLVGVPEEGIEASVDTHRSDIRRRTETGGCSRSLTLEEARRGLRSDGARRGLCSGGSRWSGGSHSCGGAAERT